MLFWLSCFFAGIALCLTFWVVFRPYLLNTGPSRTYSNKVVLRIIWPWVFVFAGLCRPFISWNTRQVLIRRIHIAGLEPVWQPDHIVGLQCLAFLAAALLASLFLLPYVSLGVVHKALFVACVGSVSMWWPRRWLHGMGVKRQGLMLKEFPFLLDMTTLCVEAGLNLHGALQQAAHHGPAGPLRQELRHALADIRTGMPRSEALQHLSNRTGLVAVQQLVTALGQADQLGMSLGPLLRSQSEQRRAERFLRAEKLALEAPVKMLFPMVFCIFPCTFLIIGFPIAVKLLGVEF